MYDNPILFFICGLGVFNGFLVAFYFLFFNKQKRVQNFFFGLLVLFLSLRIGKSLYVIFTPREERNFWLIQIGLSACFLIGISLFYYIKASVENKRYIPTSWKIHISVLVAFILIIGVLFPYPYNLRFWGTYFAYFIYLIWGIYLIASGYVLRDVLKKIVVGKTPISTPELWLIAVFIANILIYTAYLIGLFFFYFVGTITFSVVFYVLLIMFLSKRNREMIFENIPEKYAAKKITTTEADELVTELKELVVAKELYKSTSIKISDIAKELDITSHKLSQLLNDNVGKSFAAFMNDFRIAEAKKLLQERKELTLEAIGFEAGFSSKSNFYATFKKSIGQTPSEYQKQFL